MIKTNDDSEMPMAKSDLYNLARNCIELYKLIKDLPELEGWTQAKITKSADYITSVLNYMKHEAHMDHMSLNEMASAGGTSAGAIAVSPMPLGKKKKIIQREETLSEGNLSNFRPPFRAGGLWVSDSNDRSVLEVVSHGSLSKEVAKALNQYVGVKENWNATIQSIPRTEPFKHKKIVVVNPRGKTWTFDTEDEARSMFPDSWEKIKAGLPGFKVTGLAEAKSNPGKKIKTESGTAILTPEGVKFNNSGYRDSFTWDQIKKMNDGEEVEGWIREEDDFYNPPDVYVYTSGAEVEHHLPMKAIPKEYLGGKNRGAVSEEKQKGVDGKACWDGYKRMGTKKKGGKTVDNCVPIKKKK